MVLFNSSCIVVHEAVVLLIIFLRSLCMRCLHALLLHNAHALCLKNSKKKPTRQQRCTLSPFYLLFAGRTLLPSLLRPAGPFRGSRTARTLTRSTSWPGPPPSPSTRKAATLRQAMSPITRCSEWGRSLTWSTAHHRLCGNIPPSRAFLYLSPSCLNP